MFDHCLSVFQAASRLEGTEIAYKKRQPESPVVFINFVQPYPLLRMKITLLTYGSRGDIQPFVALVRGL